MQNTNDNVIGLKWNLNFCIVSSDENWYNNGKYT
jgi:hypothetical protein